MQTSTKSTLNKAKPNIKLVKTNAINEPKKRQAYKYTEQFVYKELEDLQLILKDNEQIKTKKQLFSFKPYSTDKFSAWRRKYGESKRINEALQKIDDILEARLVEQGLNGKNFPFVIFLLKNHYGYQDKREVETETTHVFKVSRGAGELIKTQKPIKLPSTIKT